MQTRFDGQERLYQAIRLMRRIDLNVGRVMQAELRSAGLTPAQRLIVEALIDHGAMTVPETAACLSLKRQFVQRIATALLAAELVEIQPNPAHKRSPRLVVTGSGRKKFNALHERELALLHQHLGDINMTEIIVALRVMNRVSACFSELAEKVRGETPVPLSGDDPLRSAIG